MQDLLMIFFVKSDFLHQIHVIPTKFTSGMYFCEEPNTLNYFPIFASQTALSPLG